MKACPSMAIDWRIAARTTGATSGLVSWVGENSPESSTTTSGSSRPAAPSSVNPVRSSRSVSPGTPAARTAASRSAMSWSARFGSGVRSSASARLMSARPCALSSGNCSSMRSMSGRERLSERAASTQRAARTRAAVSAPLTVASSASASPEAVASGRSVAARNRARRLARSSAALTGSALRLQHLGDGACEILEIAAPQPRYVHPTVVGHVDVVLLAELAYLGGIDAEEREHAALLRDEAEIALRTVLAQVLDHLAPQAADAAAHGGNLLRPLRTQRRIAEDRLHDRRTVVGGHRPDAACQAHELAERCIRRGRR